ncbi:hypothetical protein GGX14DRAFT_393068 [Mycena pura]|uniref:Uncharacterized protein n=1 Tax=Mycena pura TaxID=153505 RepID=A0AAD6VJV0_9AGAR|nr:hypothetical protein GGX14DRAFT_393068 [Mycena pura]
MVFTVLFNALILAASANAAAVAPAAISNANVSTLGARACVREGLACIVSPIIGTDCCKGCFCVPSLNPFPGRCVRFFKDDETRLESNKTGLESNKMMELEA